MALQVINNQTALGANRSIHQYPPPDLIQNIVPKDVNKQNSQYSARLSSTNPRKSSKSKLQSSETNKTSEADKPTETKQNRRKKFKRGLCCLGWIFCCPLFSLSFMLRDSPMDKQDLKDDPCCPCYS